MALSITSDDSNTSINPDLKSSLTHESSNIITSTEISGEHVSNSRIRTEESKISSTNLGAATCCLNVNSNFNSNCIVESNSNFNSHSGVESHSNSHFGVESNSSLNSNSNSNLCVESNLEPLTLSQRSKISCAIYSIGSKLCSSIITTDDYLCELKYFNCFEELSLHPGLNLLSDKQQVWVMCIYVMGQCVEGVLCINGELGVLG